MRERASGEGDGRGVERVFQSNRLVRVRRLPCDDAERGERLAAVGDLPARPREALEHRGADGRLGRRIPVPAAERAAVNREPDTVSHRLPARLARREEAVGAADHRADREAVARERRRDADAEDLGVPAEIRAAEGERGEGAGRSGREHDDVGPRRLSALDLTGELQHRVEVAEVRKRVRGARQDEVVAWVATERAPRAPRRPCVAAAVHKLGAGVDEAEERLPRELGDRLLEQHGPNLEAERAAEESRGHDLRRGNPAGRHEAASPARLGVGEDELVAADLVASIERRDENRRASCRRPRDRASRAGRRTGRRASARGPAGCHGTPRARPGNASNRSGALRPRGSIYGSLRLRGARAPGAVGQAHGRTLLEGH